MTYPRTPLSIISISMFHRITNMHSSIIIWILFITTLNPNFSIAVSTVEIMVEDIAVLMANSSTILLSWKIEYNFTRDIRSLAVWHRPRNRVDLDQPRLEYDYANGRYRARYGVDESEYEWKTDIHTEFFEESKTSSVDEMLIYTGGLFADMEYDFIVHRMALSSQFSHRTAKIVAKTKVAPVKTGAGCFRVIDVGFASRTVQFFWRGFSEPGEYDLEIREEGPCFNKEPVLVERGPLVKGVKEVSISKKRHWFVIRRHGYPEAGESVVNIPHQDDILDEPRELLARRKESEGKYILTWSKPADVTVANYTIFWMGYRMWENQRRKAIMDLVHVPGHRRFFVVTSDEEVILFWAANTDSTSTGLRMIEHRTVK